MDPGEKTSAVLKREFGEEAMNSLQKSRADTQIPKKEEELDLIPNSQDGFNSTNAYLMPLMGSWGWGGSRVSPQHGLWSESSGLGSQL